MGDGRWLRGRERVCMRVIKAGFEERTCQAVVRSCVGRGGPIDSNERIGINNGLERCGARAGDVAVVGPGAARRLD
jgi:hypothetical protein